MSLKCPFCQSAEIIMIEMNQQSSSALAQVVSPATLGALGATVAKSFNLPPLVGGVAGTVIGGLINAATEQPTLPQQSLCYCQSCTQKFPSSLLHAG